MIEKKTVIDQIEITRDHVLQIRLGLLLIEDGKEIDCKWHRTAVPPGGDIDAQLALVDDHLASMNKARLDNSRIPELKAIAQLVHTKERVDEYRRRAREADAIALGRRPA